MKNRWRKSEFLSAVRKHSKSGVSRKLAECIYVSRLLGRQSSLVQHGGGNSSVKIKATDPAGQPVDGMFIKGSGYELSEITANGFSKLNLSYLRQFEALKSFSDDEMIHTLSHAKINPLSPQPSVESLIHAFLPSIFILHTHANAVLAITNQPDGKKIADETFGRKVAILPYSMSGLELAQKAAKLCRAEQKARALVVLKHGVFSFGDTAQEAYDSMIEVVNCAEKQIKSRYRKRRSQTHSFKSNLTLSQLAPILRGSIDKAGGCSAGVILEFRTNDNILDFVNGAKLRRYGQAGPVTPDHVIWTKPRPLILTKKLGIESIGRDLKKFCNSYRKYFDHYNNLAGGHKIISDVIPKVIFVPGLGLFGVGKSREEASITADLAETSVEVIRNAESLGKYSPASPKDIFDIEYWAPEQKKLDSISTLPLAGRVVVITGAGSGIGAAIAREFKGAGAEIAVLDIKTKAANIIGEELNGLGLSADVTDRSSIGRAFKKFVETFGGVDVVISNAGAAWQGEIGTVSDRVLRKSFELNFFAHQNVAQYSAEIMRLQHSAGGSGGTILFNVSKQAVNPGRSFGPYGLPKAATMFLIRQYALDHGKDGIRTGGVNADRVRSGMLTEKLIGERSIARNVSKEKYMTENLLGREVLETDVAKAFLHLALSSSTTGAVLTVDGGNIAAALR